MLHLNPRKKRNINGVYKEGNALYLEAEAGTIRIMPQTERIIRVSYTENGRFVSEQGDELSDLSKECRWNYEENEDEVWISTDCLYVKIKMATGSVSYKRADGFLLLAEKEWESKIVEEFDSYKAVINENTKIEEIQTPDGIKRVIKETDKEFARKLYHTRLSLQFEKDERLFGLGQAEEGVWNLRNTTQYLHQANMKIANPLLLSDKGYGILLSTQSPAIFNDTQYGSYLYTEADEYLDYYFIAGEKLDEVIDGFRRLTGKAAMLPKWAYGYVQSQERYETAEEIIETATRIQDAGFGLDTIVLDWESWPGGMWGQKSFDLKRFPDPSGMIAELHERNVHLMLSIWPNMNTVTDNYQEFLDAGLLLPASEIYDAYDEKARKLYWEQVKRGLFCHNIDAWWCDSNEPVTPEWGRHIKPEPSDMYNSFVIAAGSCIPIQKANAYGLYHARAIYEGQRGETEEKRLVNLTRNGYMGCQKYGTIFWSGDISAKWETLKKQIAAGLHFCASGLPYWTLDIGAFFVKRGVQWFWDGDYDAGTDDLGYRELYVRWFQYGAFLPIFRSHGTDCRREPWNFGKEGEPFYDALLAANHQRYRLLPYIYSLAADVWRDNSTMMRMLAFDFTKDKRAIDCADEYMFGPSLLVCPVTEPMYYTEGSVPIENPVRKRTVYLPAGTSWYDLRTHERYEGGQEITVRAEIDSIPVFVKAGAVIPMMEYGSSTAEMDGRDIMVQVYAGEDGTFTLYEDAGDGYGYEKGAYCLTTISYWDESGEVRLSTEGDETFRKGEIHVEMIGRS